MALIELDLTARPETAPPSPPPAHRYRLPGLLIALLLVAALGGAGPGTSPLWQEAGSVPLPSVETPFIVSDGLLVAVAADGYRDDGSAQPIATAWTLGDQPRELWSTRIPARVTGRDNVGYARIDAERAGDVVLVSNGPATTAIEVRTGRALWSRPVPVQTLPGDRVGVFQDQVFRPGTVYDQDSGDPGMLYFTSAGEPHVEPPLRTDVHGIDLTTGRTLWTAPVAGSVNVLVAPGDAAAVLIVASDRLERRDGGTGALQGRAPLPTIGRNGPIGGELVDGTLLVHYGVAGGADVGYEPGTLRRLWSRDTPSILLDPAGCAGVICLGGRSDLRVLDPATGRPLWRAPGSVDLTRAGGYVLEVDSRSGLLTAVADPSTGRPRVDLGRWKADVVSDLGRQIVVRSGQSGQDTYFGVVLSRRDTLQPLGRVRGWVSDCTADSGHVVCRGRGGLRIWAYRA